MQSPSPAQAPRAQTIRSGELPIAQLINHIPSILFDVISAGPLTRAATACCVMSCAYTGFARLYQPHHADNFLVTRAKRNVLQLALEQACPKPLEYCCRSRASAAPPMELLGVNDRYSPDNLSPHQASYAQTRRQDV
jgi:hypothetical protein